MSAQSAVDVEVRLRLKDGATAGMVATEKTAEQIAEKAATATERASRRAAQATEQGNARQRASDEQTALARQTLGVRGERAIQQEIAATRRAYGTLAAAGFASAQEQERAYAAVSARVTALTNEMGKLTAAQRRAAEEAKQLGQLEADRERGQKALRIGATALAGGMAAAYTLHDPARQAMGYDRRLAGMANTAYAERDASGRIAGMKTLESAIVHARRVGGGTREQAAEALDTMIASGTVSAEEAGAMLPGIMKAATGSGADANALATIAIRAKQSFKIRADDIPAVLSAAMAAGQAGGFELKDMAKWLPQQMAMAGNLGLSGKEGLAKLAAWNQASVVTAGSKDEAGNNLRDLLNELNTPHFRKFIAEQYVGDGRPVKKGEKAQRLKDIDAIYLDYQSRGVDKVSATVDIMDKVFAKDKTYQALQGKLRGLDPADKEGRRAVLESMAAQVQGTNVGKVFHNQQSLMAFLGLMNNQEYVKDVLGKVRAEYTAPSDRSALSTAFAVSSATAGFKVEQAKEDALAAQKSAMDGLTPAIGKAASAFGDLAQRFPVMTGITTLAATALAALAGAAGLAALSMGGKIPGTGALGRYAGRVAGSAVGQRVLTAGKVGGLAGLGALVGDVALEQGFGAQSAISRYGSSALNGAAMGATLGSVVPGLGTGVGAAAGGALGLAWEGIKDLLKPAEPKPVDVNARLQVGLAPGLVLQGQSMQATGGKVYMDTGNLMTGAP